MMKLEDIEYDKEIEVTETQYKECIKHLSGIVAHRIVDNKFYVKLWLMNYNKELLYIIENN